VYIRTKNIYVRQAELTGPAWLPAERRIFAAELEDDSLGQPISAVKGAGGRQTDSKGLWIHAGLDHAYAGREGLLVELGVEELRDVVEDWGGSAGEHGATGRTDCRGSAGRWGRALRVGTFPPR
jgi:hypothetical protein